MLQFVYRSDGCFLLPAASVSDGGSTVEGTDRRRPRALRSSQCKGTSHSVSSHRAESISCTLTLIHKNKDTLLPLVQGVPVSTASCVQLHKRAEKIAAALTEKGSINTGENVVLLYPPGRFCLPAASCPSPAPTEINYCHSWKIFSLHPPLRHRFDRGLLRLSLRRMCPCKRPTSTPSEPGGHVADCPHDH